MLGRSEAGPPSRDRRWHQDLIESIDATRTTLLHLSRVEGLKSVMVTSAGVGEGKTSLSTQLSASLARAGRRTLLIDCDLRRPVAHQLFDETLEPGVCEQFRGEDVGESLIRATPLPQPLVHDRRPLRRSGLAVALAEWAQLIARFTLAEQFDFIVVDTAPVLPVPDSLMIAQQVDAVIFSILRDVSRVPDVQVGARPARNARCSHLRRRGQRCSRTDLRLWIRIRE